MPNTKNNPFADDSALEGAVSEDLTEKTADVDPVQASKTDPDTQEPAEIEPVTEHPEAFTAMSPAEARTAILAALQKVGITPLRVLASWTDLTIELAGKSHNEGTVFAATDVPGIYNPGSSSRDLQVQYISDNLGGTARTILTITRG